MKHNILLGLTTTPGSDWREKVREIDQYNLKEVALFPTFLKNEERKILYRLLEKTTLKTIPHVHLRDDSTLDEVKYCMDRWGTFLFNIHPDWEIQQIEGYSKITNLWVENSGHLRAGFEEKVQAAAGICLDYSHYHDHWLLSHDSGYEIFPSLLEKYKIGCCHISAIFDKPSRKAGIMERYGDHHIDELSNLDYMKNYIELLPEIVSIELENSFREQLEAKNYLEKLIKRNK